ncbi:extracellular solute-binding protein [Halorussus amylolyticus]|uniref:extracellular solute-binding protein n=1 Tax=Halorussus amylolyticus TaxID=1126242 RepID=UPI0034A12D92
MRAVGASGAAVGLAGCTGDGGGSQDTTTEGGSDDSGTTTGSVDNDGGTTTLQWATDPDFEDVWDTLQDVLHENGLSNDIEVEILAGSSVTDDRQAQYQQWLSAGRSKPDILYVDSGWTIPFIMRDQLQNLSGMLGSDRISQLEDDYFQASVSTARGPDGDLFAIPLFPDFPTMQYNKSYVSEAGYGEDDFETWAEESMTWQEFSNVTSEALDANDDVDYGFTFQADSYEGLACCDFNEFMTSWGGAYFGNPEENLFGPIGDRPVTVGEDQVVDSVRMIRTFIHGSDAEETLDDYAGDISPDAVLQWTEEPSRKPFTNGNAVMHRNWPYAINTSASEDNLGDDLGVMPIPYAVTEDEAEYPGTGGPVAALGGWHNAINPNSENKEAALEVLTAMMSEEFKLALFEELGFLPPEPDLLDTDRAGEVPIMGQFLPQLKVAGENAIPRPVTPIWPNQSQRIAQQVNDAYSESGDPVSAMSTLQQQLEEIEQSA